MAVELAQEFQMGRLKAVERHFHARKQISSLFLHKKIETVAVVAVDFRANSKQANMDAGTKHCAVSIILHVRQLLFQMCGSNLHLGADDVGNLMRVGEAIPRGLESVHDSRVVDSTYQAHERAVIVAVNRNSLLSHVGIS